MSQAIVIYHGILTEDDMIFMIGIVGTLVIIIVASVSIMYPEDFWA